MPIEATMNLSKFANTSLRLSLYFFSLVITHSCLTRKHTCIRVHCTSTTSKSVYVYVKVRGGVYTT